MLLLQGNTEASIIFENLDRIFDKELEFNDIDIDIDQNIKPLFYRLLLSKTFIFYIEKDSFIQAKLNVNFLEISDKIIFIDDIESLIILYKLNKIKKINYDINWIAVELNANNLNDEILRNYSQKQILNIMHCNKIVSCLNFYKKGKIEPNIQYRIDFEHLEQRFKMIRFPIDKLVKNARKYFFKNLFKIKIKNNSKKFIMQELKQISYVNIQITKEDYKNIYKYKCQLCGNEHQVILSKSQKNKHNKKYIKVSKDFIQIKDFKNMQRVFIYCNHKNTPFENSGYYFNFDLKHIISEDKINDYIKNLTNNELDKIFIFQFFNFLKDDNNIKYYKNGKKSTILINDFIKKIYSNKK